MQALHPDFDCCRQIKLKGRCSVWLRQLRQANNKLLNCSQTTESKHAGTAGHSTAQTLLYSSVDGHYSTADIQRQHTESASTLTTSRGADAGRAIDAQWPIFPIISFRNAILGDYVKKIISGYLEHRFSKAESLLGTWSKNGWNK